MQQAVLGYLAIHSTTHEDTEELDKIFKSLDKNHDGKVSKEEFLSGFKIGYNISILNLNIFNTWKIKTVYPEMSKEEAEKIINEADVNNSGLIDYIEWIQATIDKLIITLKFNIISII